MPSLKTKKIGVRRLVKSTTNLLFFGEREKCFYAQQGRTSVRGKQLFLVTVGLIGSNLNNLLIYCNLTKSNLADQNTD